MLKNILLVGSLLGLAGNAWAVPFLQGDLAFGIAPNASWEATGGSGVFDATGIQFNAASGNFFPFHIYNGYDGLVSSASGDFAGTVTAPVDFHDFTFNPLGPLGGSQPLLWSFTHVGTNYALQMTSADIVSQTSGQISLSGAAILTANGYADTNGSFEFTANGSGTSFSYSSSAAVPEPASLALFGIGILGMAFPQIRRREENS